MFLISLGNGSPTNAPEGASTYELSSNEDFVVYDDFDDSDEFEGMGWDQFTADDVGDFDDLIKRMRNPFPHGDLTKDEELMKKFIPSAEIRKKYTKKSEKAFYPTAVEKTSIPEEKIVLASSKKVTYAPSVFHPAVMEKTSAPESPSKKVTSVVEKTSIPEDIIWEKEKKVTPVPSVSHPAVMEKTSAPESPSKKVTSVVEKTFISEDIIWEKAKKVTPVPSSSTSCVRKISEHTPPKKISSVVEKTSIPEEIIWETPKTSPSSSHSVVGKTSSTLRIDQKKRMPRNSN
jgi:hypothetical protein